MTSLNYKYVRCGQFIYDAAERATHEKKSPAERKAFPLRAVVIVAGDCDAEKILTLLNVGNDYCR